MKHNHYHLKGQQLKTTTNQKIIMNKKISSLSQASSSGAQKIASVVTSAVVGATMTSQEPEVGGVKFKKLKIKTQKMKSSSADMTSKDHHGHDSSSLMSSVMITADSSVGGHSALTAEFTAKDHLLAGILYAVKVSTMTQQDPLPPFLLSDHFKSSVKYSVKASSNPSVFAPNLSYPLSLAAINSLSAEEEQVEQQPIMKNSSSDDVIISLPLSLPNAVKVKEYAPLVFATLRDKVYSFATKTLFLPSLFDPNHGPPFPAKNRSGNRLLYVSGDRQVIIKAIEGQDVESLLSLLKTLHPYLVSNRRSQSLLPQYLSCYRLMLPTSSAVAAKAVTSSEGHVIYVLLQRNPLSGEESFFPIHDVFCITADSVKKVDLTPKSSSSSDDDQRPKKDNNKRSLQENDLQIILKKSDGERLLSSLEADLKFLSGHLLVGYSLLVGVHSIDLWEKELTADQEEEHVLASNLEAFSLKEDATKKGNPSRKESLSLVIDSSRHPFALPSPFVGVDSRASSRPSLYSAEDTESSVDQDQSTATTFGANNGRFVYFIGFDDLLPLSASFSSKELNLSKKSASKKKAEESTTETTEEVNTMKKSEEMGKKEAAREYSKNVLLQLKKRLLLVNDTSS